MAKKTKQESITLADLTTRFISHLEETGKSAGTCFSYLMELKLAQNHFGADALLSALTQDAVAAFNTTDRVMKLKSGLDKSQLSIDKTRRVLRLALTYAHTSGWLADALVDPKRDALVQREMAVVEPSEPAAAPKKKRARKTAIVLEVPQPEAEAAADTAESMIANAAQVD